MIVTSRYDTVAGWYDVAMTDPGVRGGLARTAHELVARLLGPGTGLVLDVGTGTGLVSAPLRRLGYTPVGIDLSLGQLHIAAGRLPVAQANAAELPFADESVPRAVSTFVSSDLDDFGGAVREIHRVLRRGGRYVVVCVHPCFDGNHTRRNPDDTVTLLPGYRRSHYAPPSHFTTSVRGKVGAWHRPLAEQLNTYLDAGLHLLTVAEDGTRDIPDQLALSFVKH